MNPPTLRGALAFGFGFWLVVSFAEGSLWALIDERRELQTRVNELRAERNLIPLRSSAALARVAQAHAAEMAREGYLSHTDLRGLDPLQRARLGGVEGFRLLAENIGASTETESLPAIVRGWLESPIHRENLLNPAFNTTGVGHALAPEGKVVVVQLYATY